MTVLARIHTIHDNGLVLTIPGNLRARVSLNEITDITGNSTKDTEMQESEEDDDDEEEGENEEKEQSKNSSIDPSKLFKVGQPIRAVILAVDAGIYLFNPLSFITSYHIYF